MLFHAARFESRTDDAGATIPLEEQDRSKWDFRMMRVAERWLQRSACGSDVSRYHLEAGIARLHCQARCSAETNWLAILHHYEKLALLFPSPLHDLNRAIVLGRLGRETDGLQLLESIENEKSMRQYPLLQCAYADLLIRAGKNEQAIDRWQRAYEMVSSDHERQFIRQKLVEFSKK